MRFVAVRLRAERFSAKRSAWKLSAALTADTVPFQVISRTGLSRVETLTKCSGICLMLQSPSEQSAAQHLVNVQRTTSEILLLSGTMLSEEFFNVVGVKVFLVYFTIVKSCQCHI